jgi:alkylated DNA repair protein (DNA oxidative demethylase)
MPSQLVLDLPEPAAPCGARELSAGAWLLTGLALPVQSQVLLDLERVAQVAPFRHMVTPGGFRMSAAMTNCGALGWVSDESGYRYATVDPESGEPWPALPRSFRKLAGDAAEAAGFPGFEPDACLVNRYAPGARLTLHQDKNEIDYRAPIVSVSLGLPAVFLFGGETRKTRPERIPLVHGDVVVWGGPARLRFHGVAPIRDGRHALLGGFRLNLTLRKAG